MTIHPRSGWVETEAGLLSGKEKVWLYCKCSFSFSFSCRSDDKLVRLVPLPYTIGVALARGRLSLHVHWHDLVDIGLRP